MEILETVEKQTDNGFMRYIKAADDKMFFNNSSIWLKRFAKFLVLILLMIGVWLGKAYGTPRITVECLQDPIQNYLTVFNDLINHNIYVAQFFQITSSLLMDFTFFILYFYWMFHAESGRLLVSTVGFYVIRAICQLLVQMRYPDGFYWNYPGFPSFVVPYGRSSDFFFSGHCGFLMICTLEWHSLKKYKMCWITLGINCYMAFVMLIFRIHYAIDITTGIIVAHYCYIITTKYQEGIDNYFSNFLEKSYVKYIFKKNTPLSVELESQQLSRV